MRAAMEVLRVTAGTAATVVAELREELGIRRLRGELVAMAVWAVGAALSRATAVMEAVAVAGVPLGRGSGSGSLVGVVAPDFMAVPDPREVAEIFEVKLSFFLDPANAQLIHRELAGRPRSVHVFEPDGRTIWGITAALLFDFAGRLKAGHAIGTP